MNIFLLIVLGKKKEIKNKKEKIIECEENQTQKNTVGQIKQKSNIHKIQ